MTQFVINSGVADQFEVIELSVKDDRDYEETKEFHSVQSKSTTNVFASTERINTPGATLLLPERM